MATGTGNLPYPGKSYSPFAILTAEELNQDVANIESLATGTGQGDGSIPNSALSAAAGQLGGSWQSWTPNYLAGLAVGNGTVDAAYQQVGKTVRFRFKLTVGSTTTIGSSTPPMLSLPVPSKYTNMRVDGVGALNAGSEYVLFVRNNTGNNTSFRIGYITGATPIMQNLVQGSPTNITTGNTIEINGQYEAA